jgi:hypothetical protein
MLFTAENSNFYFRRVAGSAAERQDSGGVFVAIS